MNKDRTPFLAFLLTLSVAFLCACIIGIDARLDAIEQRLGITPAEKP